MGRGPEGDVAFCVDDSLIRAARPDEHGEIAALASRSKGHWGYSSEFLEACRVELTYDAPQCGSGRMWVAVAESAIVGFSRLVAHHRPASWRLCSLNRSPSPRREGNGQRWSRGEHAVWSFRRRGL